MPADHHNYVGFKVVAALLTAFPIEQAFYGGDLTVLGRILLAVSAGAGAALLVMVDRPRTVFDAATRVGVGVGAGFLFVPHLCNRWSITEWNGAIALAAGVGSVSWFVVGAVAKVLTRAQTKDWFEALIRARFGIPTAPTQPGTERTVEVKVAEKTTTPPASAVVGTGRS